MASSFLICYPDVPASALTVSASQTYDDDYRYENTFYGIRHSYGQLSSNQSSVAITYDLGTGNSRTVDYFALGGVTILRANGVTEARLQGSSDGSTWVNQLGTASAFQTRTLDGPNDADMIFTAAYNDDLAGTLAAYRYFKVTLSGGTAHKFPVSKIFFGASFDMGKEPDFYDIDVATEQDSDTWKYPRGHTLMTRAYHPVHRFTVEWDGVTDAKATSFMTTILQNPYRSSLFLYAATYADPLYDNKLINCRVLDGECSVEKEDQDWNVVRAVFEELP